ncbi:hypothetical protein GCM10010191_05130 [Actinomadura vinacea]|uniref:Uncharacterized protein n=1 Tax=Actinomadura vinacea TaxID=115336 RepID=A0ABN3IEQ4_9ACTN
MPEPDQNESTSDKCSTPRRRKRVAQRAKRVIIAGLSASAAALVDEGAAAVLDTAVEFTQAVFG